MKKLHLLIAVILLTGCASAGNYGECELTEPTVITSSNVHIVVEFLDADRMIANRLAEKWCSGRGLKSHEERASCNGCCRSSFQCR
jgi:uncharacterized lipoprotein YajG